MRQHLVFDLRYIIIYKEKQNYFSWSLVFSHGLRWLLGYLIRREVERLVNCRLIFSNSHLNYCSYNHTKKKWTLHDPNSNLHSNKQTVWHNVEVELRMLSLCLSGLKSSIMLSLYFRTLDISLNEMKRNVCSRCFLKSTTAFKGTVWCIRILDFINIENMLISIPYQMETPNSTSNPRLNGAKYWQPNRW